MRRNCGGISWTRTREAIFRPGTCPCCGPTVKSMRAEQGEVIETASGAVKRNPWHEVLVNSNSSLSQLATKLRLCVNSRINAKAAGKHDEKPKPKRAGLMFGA